MNLNANVKIIMKFVGESFAEKSNLFCVFVGKYYE